MERFRHRADGQRKDDGGVCLRSREREWKRASPGDDNAGYGGTDEDGAQSLGKMSRELSRKNEGRKRNAVDDVDQSRGQARQEIWEETRPALWPFHTMLAAMQKLRAYRFVSEI